MHGLAVCAIEGLPFVRNLSAENFVDCYLRFQLNLLDSSKTSGPDCIRVVVLKNREPGLLYILAGFFNIYQKVLFSKLLNSLIGGSCI